MSRRLLSAFTAAVAALALGLVSDAAAAHKPQTLTVGPTKGDASCPAAQFDSIREAIEAAGPGDTVYVCAGTYVEGSGDVGSNALEIHNDLNLEGAGADQVFVHPRHAGENRIAAEKPSLHKGNGYLLAVLGHGVDPIDVDVSGITFDASGVYATAGIVYRDAEGSIERSRVTGLAVDESADGWSVAGGFRSNSFGIGIAMVTRATPHQIKPRTPRRRG
jgi:hypothetical protein